MIEKGNHPFRTIRRIKRSI